jgi:hypothetical protein
MDRAIESPIPRPWAWSCRRARTPLRGWRYPAPVGVRHGAAHGFTGRRADEHGTVGPPSPVIASMALIVRFSRTCCSCTRRREPPGGRRRDARRRRAGGRRWPGGRRPVGPGRSRPEAPLGSPFRRSSRNRRMTSPARRSSGRDVVEDLQELGGPGWRGVANEVPRRLGVGENGGQRLIESCARDACHSPIVKALRKWAAPAGSSGLRSSARLRSVTR